MFGSIVLRKSIGFIGLGQMGYPMASNLYKSKQYTEFYVNDHQPATSSNFIKDVGGKQASIEDIGKKCDLIVTMLPASNHVRQVYLGKNGLLLNLKKGALVIDSSTIDVSTVKEVNQQLKQRGVHMVDAPVSGGKIFNRNWRCTSRNLDFHGWSRKARNIPKG